MDHQVAEAIKIRDIERGVEAEFERRYEDHLDQLERTHRGVVFAGVAFWPRRYRRIIPNRVACDHLHTVYRPTDGENVVCLDCGLTWRYTDSI
ncbi:MAG: hypothetical protein KGL39_16525 [Patescibacteria group bacterium]|nr:hypothetical protein [Patescibacteria group bacterium]